jgi:hypothetical protein
VSLTSELRDPASPVTRWISGRFPGVAPLEAGWAAHVAGARTVRPRGRVDWALLGQAFGHRLGFAFGLDPPYAAVLGAGAYTASGQVRHLASACFPTVRALPGRLAGSVRVLGPDRYLPLLGTGPAAGPEPGPGPGDAWLLDVFTHAAGLVERLGARPPDPDHPDERELLAACYILAILERAYRGGTREPALIGRTPVELLGLVPALVVDDLLAMTRVLAGEGGRGLEALGGPAVVAPMLVEHWADGDLALGGTLVDCKATVRPVFKLTDFHQAVAYVLLDHGDWYGLDAAAIYLARQGRLVRWPLERILAATGDPVATLPGLREELAGVLLTTFGDALLRRWTVHRPAGPLPASAFQPPRPA